VHSYLFPPGPAQAKNFESATESAARKQNGSTRAHTNTHKRSAHTNTERLLCTRAGKHRESNTHTHAVMQIRSGTASRAGGPKAVVAAPQAKNFNIIRRV